MRSLTSLFGLSLRAGHRVAESLRIAAGCSARSTQILLCPTRVIPCSTYVAAVSLHLATGYRLTVRYLELMSPHGTVRGAFCLHLADHRPTSRVAEFDALFAKHAIGLERIDAPALDLRFRRPRSGSQGRAPGRPKRGVLPLLLHPGPE